MSTPLSAVCGSSGMRYNLKGIDLAEGMESTDEMMFRDGMRAGARSAATLLEKRPRAVKSRKPRLGLLKDGFDDVASELGESIAFARTAAAKGARFDFAIPM